MPIDRKAFFGTVRVQLFDGHLSAEQVAGMDRILDEWERRKLLDLRWLGNMLAHTNGGSHRLILGDGVVLI